MLKLQFNSPTYLITSDSNNVTRTICKLDSKIIESRTGEVLVTLSNSGVSKCNPNDHFDAQFGRDLALSRAKYNNYSGAFDVMVEEADDSMSALLFICAMSRNIMKEHNHQQFLFGEEEDYDIPSLRELFLANAEIRLPLLRSDVPTFFDESLYIG